ncbi:tudor domain-containing protein 1-like [Ornithodoros turicata]|uniref:tudor domain-containing protein 1-like n=1 Tax=Ornithodoros turicata TaxID=34597 RepID=UPI00313907D0
MWQTLSKETSPEWSTVIPEPSDVPLGVSVPVEVTYYSSPIRIFLKYNFASEHAENVVCNASHLYSAHVGMFCVVYCETPEGFHRAQITDIHSDQNGIQIAAEVFYVDRGDVDIVGLDAVLPIDERIAAQANLTVPCCIRTVRPTQLSSRQDLHELTSYGTGLYEAIFHGVSEAGVYDIDLFMIDTNVGKPVERRNVADMLVQRGFATYLLYPIKTIRPRVIHDQTSELSDPVSQEAEQPVHDVVWQLPSPVVPGTGLIDVNIMHILTPDHWYAQLAASEMQMKSIQRLLSPVRMNGACKLKEYHKGTFCIYKETPSAEGFRARIEANEEQGIHLSLIDYGEEVSTNSACLYAMDRELSAYPPLALRFQLHNIRPWGVWTEAAAFKFKRLLKMNGAAPVSVPAQVVSVSGGREGKIVTVNLVDEAVGNLGEILIQEGYARKPAKNEICHDKLRFRTHDPMKQDYESCLNSYKIDTDDPGVATTQYAVRNEAGVCRYFSRNGSCRYGDRCSYRHIYGDRNTVMLRDSDPVPCVDTCRVPKIGSFVLGQVSAFASPSLFYLVFPYGTRDISRLPTRHGGEKETLHSLTAEMQREYSRRTFDDNTLSRRACGEVVAAYSRRQEQWQRAHVISTNHNTVRVTYPDFGDTEWVPTNLVRDLKAQFMHLPFQAVQACMADVQPRGHKRGAVWDRDCITVVERWTSGKVLLVEVVDHVYDVLHVKLFTYEDNRVESLGGRLGDAALAEFHSKKPCAAPGGMCNIPL